jgi:hypothetical protein
MDVFFEAELQICAVPSGAWDGEGDGYLVIVPKHAIFFDWHFTCQR